MTQQLSPDFHLTNPKAIKNDPQQKQDKRCDYFHENARKTLPRLRSLIPAAFS